MRPHPGRIAQHNVETGALGVGEMNVEAEEWQRVALPKFALQAAQLAQPCIEVAELDARRACRCGRVSKQITRGGLHAQLTLLIRKALPKIGYCAGPYEAMKGADALVILTEWNAFRSLDLLRIKALLKTPVVVDLRNIYNPQDMAAAGFAYRSIGRPAAAFEDLS